MQIFDFALKMELDGEQYYRSLAAQVQYDDLKTVLIGLANDERSHYDIILAAQNNHFHPPAAAPFLAGQQNVFAINREFINHNEESIVKLKDEQIDIYRGALIKEQESVELYKNLQATAVTEAERAICITLMQEEEKHVAVLENIIEMLNHVHDWVESAEFNLKEEKY
ncbi:ferritin family protein [Sporomusa termitida]|uniref:Rubrerythrin n=1 Tax=Sporomusa termitida TaxID=2377 RepID=A0A517DQ21_9FIRM|nr:ferritin family protein [Sporomusa termitida]QDR79465.1 Rubrerythrin [Sporomusa termitida]